MGPSQVKIPAIVATGVICLALGIGIGILGTVFFGYRFSQPAAASAPSAGGPGGPPGGAMAIPGAGGQKMGGFKGPSPKVQLAGLVSKLDLLSKKPLTIALTEGQKKKVQEQLAGLQSKDEISDEDAKKRLETLLDVLKDHKETLEAAGYRWPGQGGFRPPAATANPFKEEKNAEALKSLQQRLEGKSAEKAKH